MANRSLNKVMLIGNLTRDPELKYIPSGSAVCTFGLATNRRWTTSDGQTKEDAQFHRIVCWNKLAELAGKLLTKGARVYVEGRIVYRTFTGKDNVQRTVSEIVMDDFILLSSSGATTANSTVTKNESEKKDKKKEEMGVDDIDVESVLEDEEKKDKKEGEEKEEEEDIPF